MHPRKHAAEPIQGSTDYCRAPRVHSVPLRLHTPWRSGRIKRTRVSLRSSSVQPERSHRQFFFGYHPSPSAMSTEQHPTLNAGSRQSLAFDTSSMIKETADHVEVEHDNAEEADHDHNTEEARLVRKLDFRIM